MFYKDVTFYKLTDFSFIYSKVDRGGVQSDCDVPLQY